MDRTNANDFRANLKEWMETARSEPIKITRKSGEAFVLLNADEFEKMQVELAHLRGVSHGLNDLMHGHVSKATGSSTENAIRRAQEKVLSKRRRSNTG